ncbi:2-hydroxyacid dehydrogenase [Skermanella stibiiresistens SB22]|uniref:2-hydroxyacid dehydrogenase n=1 Tax=Skermanella stibiiresistens SB22 TaxID=1385369 RepID=W9H1I8_9PROT|nr:2-hydroxyacid dehydrogenase [Skermanella stibiiresistens SB22]
MAPQVVVLEGGFGGYEVERDVLRPFGANLVERSCRGDREMLHGAVQLADAVLVRECPLDRAAFESMERCRIVVRYGVALDTIDLAAASDCRVPVANVPEFGVDEVSNHALGLLLAVARRIPSRDRDVRAGRWNIARAEPMHRLAGGTLGLIGYGRIGAAFHRKAAALGFARTLVHDPVLAEAPAGTELAALGRLCLESDVISLHASLSGASRHLIGRSMIALMKPSAILLNTARGGLIDQAALVEALIEGRLFGAGLDVFEREPPGADNLLMSAPGVVMTDHTAWYSEQSVADLQRAAAEEIARVFGGLRPLNWVNPWPESGDAPG